MVDRRDERRHDAAVDAYSLVFFTADAKLGGGIRLELVRAARTVSCWAWVVGAQRPLVTLRDDDVPLPGGRSLEIRAEGLWAELVCETPLEHWSVGVEAFAVALEDPEDAWGAERGDRVPLGFDLEWEAVAPTDAVADGYQQRCAVRGDVIVGTERVDVDAWGHRDHRWGDAVAVPAASLVARTDDGDWVYDVDEPAHGVARAPVLTRGLGRLDRELIRLARGGAGWRERLLL